MKIIQFGENIEGYNVPVLNEREIRAAAGILFLILFIATTAVVTKDDFLLFKYAVTIFFADILIRLFINPRFSPSMILGRWAVKNQTPEYVGAPQKKFAWTIGALLSGTIFTLLVIFNGASPITGIICLICLVFLFFETAFGICLGCKFYPLFYKTPPLHCAGDTCVPQKPGAQGISVVQLFIVAGFVLFIITTAFLFNDHYGLQPYDMFGIEQYLNNEN